MRRNRKHLLRTNREPEQQYKQSTFLESESESVSQHEDPAPPAPFEDPQSEPQIVPHTRTTRSGRTVRRPRYLQDYV